MGKEEAVKLHDSLLAGMPEGARHDPNTCPFCVDKASQSETTTSRIPPASGGPDVSASKQSPTNTEGGTPKTMSENEMISKETHEALVEKAIKDATSTTEGALQRKTDEAADFKSQLDTATAENTDLKAENERLNKELDEAQVSLKSAQDKVTQLEKDIEEKDKAAQRAEVASKRTEQVKNLNLFADDYIEQKVSAWADMSDEAWAERLEEWQKLKPAGSEGGEGKPKTDSASAMTGTSGTLTKESDDKANKTPARRAALGLS